MYNFDEIQGKYVRGSVASQYKWVRECAGVFSCERGGHRAVIRHAAFVNMYMGVLYEGNVMKALISVNEDVEKVRLRCQSVLADLTGDKLLILHVN